MSHGFLLRQYNQKTSREPKPKSCTFLVNMSC